jgi:hypothetical protein
MEALVACRNQIVTIPSITVGVPYQIYGTPTVMEGMSPVTLSLRQATSGEIPALTDGVITPGVSLGTKLK